MANSNNNNNNNNMYLEKERLEHRKTNTSTYKQVCNKKNFTGLLFFSYIQINNTKLNYYLPEFLYRLKSHPFTHLCNIEIKVAFVTRKHNFVATKVQTHLCIPTD